MSFHSGARTYRHEALNAGAQAQARWAAREALARTLDELERTAISRRDWESVGLGRTSPLDMGPGGPKVSVSVQMVDARARLNLNSMTPGELEKLLVALAGNRSPSVLTLRDRILDWRDADDLERVNGAEEEAYTAAGLEVGPANRPFMMAGISLSDRAVL